MDVQQPSWRRGAGALWTGRPRRHSIVEGRRVCAYRFRVQAAFEVRISALYPSASGHRLFLRLIYRFEAERPFQYDAVSTSSLLIPTRCKAAFEPFFRANIDTAIINIGHADLAPYKLVIVPADYLMDPASAKALRDLRERRRHGLDDGALSQSRRARTMV